MRRAAGLVAALLVSSLPALARKKVSFCRSSRTDPVLRKQALRIAKAQIVNRYPDLIQEKDVEVSLMERLSDGQLEIIVTSRRSEVGKLQSAHIPVTLVGQGKERELKVIGEPMVNKLVRMIKGK